MKAASKILYLPQDDPFHAQTLTRKPSSQKSPSDRFSDFFSSISNELISYLSKALNLVQRPCYRTSCKEVLCCWEPQVHCVSELCSLSSVQKQCKGQGGGRLSQATQALIQSYIYTGLMPVIYMIKCLCFSIYVCYVS